jgi:hypothetical protein
MGCNKCKTVEPCGCKESKACKPTCCPDGEFDAACIRYNRLPNRSKLLCFLGLDNNVKLSTVLETIDSKLTLKPSQNARIAFGLGVEAPIDTVVYKIMETTANIKDNKFKISASDSESGYFTDKVIFGDCINYVVSQDVYGKQTIKIELDFNCIKLKLV